MRRHILSSSLLCACLLMLPLASHAGTPEECGTLSDTVRVAMEFRLEHMAQADAITLLEHRAEADQVVWEWITRVVYGMEREDIVGAGRDDYLREVFAICLQTPMYRLGRLLEQMAAASGTTSELHDPLTYDPP